MIMTQRFRFIAETASTTWLGTLLRVMKYPKIFAPIMIRKIMVDVRIVSLRACNAPCQLRRFVATPIKADIKAPSAPTSVGVATPEYKSRRTMRISTRLGQICSRLLQRSGQGTRFVSGA
jgi:hypothetical protein